MKKIHKTADIAENAKIGNNTFVWHQAQIRENVKIGANCIIGKGVYIDSGVTVGSNVKIENYASLFHGATIEDGVFVGPYVCLTNDKNPRAITPLKTLKTNSDWAEGKIVIKKGASLGAGTIVLPDVIIGEFAMIGAGSIVTSNVESQELVFGNPAIHRGFVCLCGKVISKSKVKPKVLLCDECKKIK